MQQCNSQRISCDMSYMWENNAKDVDIEIWHGQILLTGKHNMRNAQTEQPITYARPAMYNSNQNVHVCVATELCRKIYVKYTTKQAMTSEVLLYQNA